MAASDARALPLRNVAYRVYAPILDADGDPVTGPASLDSEVSLDGAAFADCTNEWTEIGTSGIGYLDLTAAEMNAYCVIVQIKTATSGAKTTPIILYPGTMNGIERAGVAQAVTATSLTIDSPAAYPDNVLRGNIAKLTSGANAGTTGVITSHTGDVFTLAGGWMGGVTPTGTPDYEIFSTPAGDGVAQTGDVYAALTTILPTTIPADGTRPTALQAIYMTNQFQFERSVAGTTMTIKNPDGTTLLTLLLNDAALPTSVTRST